MEANLKNDPDKKVDLGLGSESEYVKSFAFSTNTARC